MTDKMTSYPVAEIFHSLQGEGVYTGTPMMFIRLAGCNVGEYIGYPVGSEDFTQFLNAGPFILVDQDLQLLRQKKHSVCTSVTGERFLCDTDYHAFTRKTIEELLAEWQENGRQQHICITGGEPFLHDLTPLVLAFQEHRVMAHIETSGTKPLRFDGRASAFSVRATGFRQLLWITCAPKVGLLPEVINDADEIKILVGDDFDEKWLTAFIRECEMSRFGLSRLTQPGRIFIQPINSVDHERPESLETCLELLKKFPGLRLSAQLHKYIRQR